MILAKARLASGSMSIAGRRRESVSPRVQARAPKASSRSVRIRAQSLSCSPACLLAANRAAMSSWPRLLGAGVLSSLRAQVIAYRSGRLPDWLKMKNADAPAVKREAEEDWGKARSVLKRTL